MSSPPRPTTAIIEEFEQLLLRWNRQISLVSRQNTPRRVKELIDQSRAGCVQIQEYLLKISGPEGSAPGDLDYFDLGSGGGIPGFLWHLWLGESDWRPETRLVEPRQKRAWFLGRLALLEGVRGLRVLEGSWPEVGGHEATAGKVTLVSLQALRMADPRILEGLQPHVAGSGGLVTICRIFPPGKTWTENLRKDLQVGQGGSPEPTNPPWKSIEITELPLPGGGKPSPGTLLVSSYRSGS